MLRFLDAANAISLLGLTASVGAAALAVDGRAAWALIALMVAGLCDLFDGLVARRMTRSDEQKRFGARLDSLVDACAFGLAPAIVLHGLGLRTPADHAIVPLLPAATVWRLAYFDTVGLIEQEGKRYYTGLPCTFVALVVPLAALAGFAGADPMRIALRAVAIALPLAMVAPVRMRKPSGAAYGVFGVLALVLIAVFAARASDFPAS